MATKSGMARIEELRAGQTLWYVFALRGYVVEEPYRVVITSRPFASVSRDGGKHYPFHQARMIAEQLKDLLFDRIKAISFNDYSSKIFSSVYDDLLMLRDAGVKTHPDDRQYNNHRLFTSRRAALKYIKKMKQSDWWYDALSGYASYDGTTPAIALKNKNHMMHLDHPQSMY